MNIMSWNCRGLGLPQTVQELQTLVPAKSPKLLFLAETRRSERRVGHLRWRLGLNNYLGIDSVSQDGGLVLFWHESVEVELIGKHQRFIDVKVRDINNSPWYRVTFIYGEPRPENQYLMWDLLQWLRLVSNLPWLVMGDFNEVLWRYEHFSDCPRSEWQMENFWDALSDCELTDIGFTGLPYTYDNKRVSSANVNVRLDRAIADTTWRDLFGDVNLLHLVSSQIKSLSVAIAS
jgi:hypothetical protein